MNKNEKQKRQFARKNNGQCINWHQPTKDKGTPVHREIALVAIPATKGKPASVARGPVLDKTMPHWTLVAQEKLWTAHTRTEALAVLDSVQPK